MNYADHSRRHRRIAILRWLNDSPGYTSNAAMIHDVLLRFGITSTRDQVTTELAWLAENGFVACDPAAPFVVATATTRGVEIATGMATHPEIQRPSPRA